MTEKVLLTPQLAKELWEHNYPQNRPVKLSVVEKYMDDIRSGRWCQNDDLLDADPMMIDKDGYLINGQHRCLAVMKSETAIYVGMKKGVDTTIYNFLDGGESRKAIDFLVNTPDRNHIVAIARVISALEDGTHLKTALNGRKSGDASYACSTTRIVEQVNKNEPYLRWLLQQARPIQAKTQIPLAQVAAALGVLGYTNCGSYIERFSDEVGNAVSTNASITLFKEFMLRAKAQKKRMDRVTNVACVLHAYDLFVTHSTPRTFSKYGSTFSKYEQLVDKQTEEGMKKCS